MEKEWYKLVVQSILIHFKCNIKTDIYVDFCVYVWCAVNSLEHARPCKSSDGFHISPDQGHSNNFIDLYCDVNPDQIHTGYQFWGYPQIVIDHDRSVSKSIPPLWINWVSIILHHLHHLSPCWLQVFATWPCHASQIVGDLPQSRQLVLRLLSLQTGLGRYGTIIIVVGLIGWPWLFPKNIYISIINRLTMAVYKIYIIIYQ